MGVVVGVSALAAGLTATRQNQPIWEFITLACAAAVAPRPAPHAARCAKDLQVEKENVLEETQRLASVYEQKLSSLEGLKKSLLHQAFSGEL